MSNSSIETFDANLVAGEDMPVGTYATQFLIMSAASPIDIIFTDAQGKKVGSASQVTEGLGVEFGEAFSFAKIKSAINQTVKIAFSTDKIVYNRVSGNVQVVNQQATVITDQTIYPVTLSPVSFKAANTLHRRIVLTADANNAGDIMIGGASMTAANAAIVLPAGLSFIESEAAAAQLFAVGTNAGDLLRWSIAT